jgi:hypothetical protein
MFMTFTGLGLVAAMSGTIIIAKAIASTNDETLLTWAAKHTGTDSSLFRMLDDQRTATSLGLSLILFGAVLALLRFTGLPLEGVTVAIIASLVLMFLAAHALYAKHLRATQPHRLAALVARIVAARNQEKALTPAADHGSGATL